MLLKTDSRFNYAHKAGPIELTEIFVVTIDMSGKLSEGSLEEIVAYYTDKEEAFFHSVGQREKCRRVRELPVVKFDDGICFAYARCIRFTVHTYAQMAVGKIDQGAALNSFGAAFLIRKKIVLYNYKLHGLQNSQRNFEYSWPLGRGGF